MVKGAVVLLGCVCAGLFHGTAELHGWGGHPLGALLVALGAAGQTLRRSPPAQASDAALKKLPLAA